MYAEGEIRDEDSSSPFSADEQVISEEMANKLRKLKDDDDVKAVVFRVNSPGGSAYISEQIWKEVVERKLRSRSLFRWVTMLLPVAITSLVPQTRLSPNVRL